MSKRAREIMGLIAECGENHVKLKALAAERYGYADHIVEEALYELRKFGLVKFEPAGRPRPETGRPGIAYYSVTELGKEYINRLQS